MDAPPSYSFHVEVWNTPEDRYPIHVHHINLFSIVFCEAACRTGGANVCGAMLELYHVNLNKATGQIFLLTLTWLQFKLNVEIQSRVHYLPLGHHFQMDALDGLLCIPNTALWRPFLPLAPTILSWTMNPLQGGNLSTWNTARTAWHHSCWLAHQKKKSPSGSTSVFSGSITLPNGTSFKTNECKCRSTMMFFSWYDIHLLEERIAKQWVI